MTENVYAGPPNVAAMPTVFTANTAGRTSRYGANQGQDTTFVASAKSPAPYAAVAAVLVAASVFVTRSITDDKAREWSFAYSIVNSTIFPTGWTLRLRETYGNEARVSSVLAIIALVSLIVLSGRIGRNLKLVDRPFSGALAAMALPLWFVLPMMVGLGDTGAIGSYGEGVFRIVLSLLIICATGLIQVVWTARVWAAGKLPQEGLSLLVSLPYVLGTIANLLAITVSVIAAGEDGSGKSPWYPTYTLQRFAEIGGYVTALATVVLLLVVAARQHLIITAERRAVAAAAAALG